MGEPNDPLVDHRAAQATAAAGPDLAWGPCDFPVEMAPGLMLGLAGTGVFYLRLSHRDLPAPLLPGWQHARQEPVCRANRSSKMSNIAIVTAGMSTQGRLPFAEFGQIDRDFEGYQARLPRDWLHGE